MSPLNGGTLDVTVNVAFTPAFTGQKNIWGHAIDFSSKSGDPADWVYLSSSLWNVGVAPPLAEPAGGTFQYTPSLGPIQDLRNEGSRRLPEYLFLHI